MGKESNTMVIGLNTNDSWSDGRLNGGWRISGFFVGWPRWSSSRRTPLQWPRRDLALDTSQAYHPCGVCATAIISQSTALSSLGDLPPERNTRTFRRTRRRRKRQRRRQNKRRRPRLCVGALRAVCVCVRVTRERKKSDQSFRTRTRDSIIVSYPLWIQLSASGD